MAALRPRELFYLQEVAQFANHALFPGDNLHFPLVVSHAAIFPYKDFYSQTHGAVHPIFPQRMRAEDPVRLFVIWDHWQDNLKNLICRKPTSNLQWDMEGEKLSHLWDYEAGDELFVLED